MPQGQQYYQAGPQEGGVVNGGPPPGPPPGGPVEDMKRRHPHPYGKDAGEGWEGPPPGGGMKERHPHPYGEGAGEGWGGPPPGPPPGGDWGADTRGQFNQGGKGMDMGAILDELNRMAEDPDFSRLGRRLWDPAASPPLSWKGGGFGPFDFTRITPPNPGSGPLWPWDLGVGWEGENWEFGGGLQGTMLGRPGGGGGMGGLEEAMRNRSIHPFLRGSYRGDMPFDLPGDWQFDAGATIDNVLNKSDLGFSINWDLLGGGAGGAGYQ